MKKFTLILVLAVLLTGGAVGALHTPSDAQVYPPSNSHAYPWVGPNTPWVYYNGDWFLNGILYYFFGPRYGWAPYYAYPRAYIVRPEIWYAPKWRAWYADHPRYHDNFIREYPYWRSHRTGEHYEREFYEHHHHGQGDGWQQGFHGHAFEGRPHPEGHR